MLDEDGEPMPGVIVRVMRYQYLQGDRRLTPAGTAQTDDKGQYRVWGLMPGDYYYVNALTRLAGLGGGAAGAGAAGAGGGGGGGPGGPGGIAGAVAAIAGGNVAALFGRRRSGADQLRADLLSPASRRSTRRSRSRSGVSQEVLDINFSMQLVRTSRVSGHVTNPDGTPTTAAT